MNADKFAALLLGMIVRGDVGTNVVEDLLKAFRDKEVPAPAKVQTQVPNATFVMNEVIGFLKAGRLIYAVKAFRDGYNVNLLAAKDSVEAIREELIKAGTLPPREVPRPAFHGCGDPVCCPE